MRSWARWLFVSAAVIALDQFSKHWIGAALPLGRETAVTPFFNLVLIHNTGAAFSLLSSASGWQRLLFSGIAILAAIVILHLLRKYPGNLYFSLALSLILGGALGNLIDRARLGYVIDFLDFYWGGYHWPAFNVADSAITLGAILLIWDSFRRPATK